MVLSVLSRSALVDELALARSVDNVLNDLEFPCCPWTIVAHTAFEHARPRIYQRFRGHAKESNGRPISTEHNTPEYLDGTAYQLTERHACLTD